MAGSLPCSFEIVGKGRRKVDWEAVGNPEEWNDLNLISRTKISFPDAVPQLWVRGCALREISTDDPRPLVFQWEGDAADRLSPLYGL